MMIDIERLGEPHDSSRGRVAINGYVPVISDCLHGVLRPRCCAIGG